MKKSRPQQRIGPRSPANSGTRRGGRPPSAMGPRSPSGGKNPLRAEPEAQQARLRLEARYLAKVGELYAPAGADEFASQQIEARVVVARFAAIKALLRERSGQEFTDFPEDETLASFIQSIHEYIGTGRGVGEALGQAGQEAADELLAEFEQQDGE